MKDAIEGTLVQVPPEATMSSMATKFGMGGGTATSLYGWLSGNNLVILVGVLTTILGFAINYYYQKKRDKREVAEHQLRVQEAQAEEKRRDEYHQARLEALRNGCEL